MSRRRRVHKSPPQPAPAMSWEDAAGFHALLPGPPPDAARLAAMEETFRQQIRATPEWEQLVREQGLAQAEKLLREIKARLGP